MFVDNATVNTALFQLSYEISVHTEFFLVLIIVPCSYGLVTLKKLVDLSGRKASFYRKYAFSRTLAGGGTMT